MARVTLCLLLGLLSAFFTGCSRPEALRVSDFHLRSASEQLNTSDLLVESEEKYRFYGAVSKAERESKRGHYYTVRYEGEPAGGEVQLIFQYQQARSGAKILRKSLNGLPSKGVAEFQIIGDDYKRQGPILAWKIIMKQAGKKTASRQSYLWQ